LIEIFSLSKLRKVYQIGLKYLWEREFLQPFYVHQWVDVEDTTARWLEAQIIDVNGPMVAIHYKGWKRKYDEWLDLSKGSPDWDRISRPLSRFRDHSPTKPNHSKFVKWLRTGFMFKFTEPVIMVHDTTDKWVEASVIGYRTWSPNCAQVRVTYHGWDKKYDEWIDVESYRLAPRPAFPPEALFVHTAAGAMPEEEEEIGPPRPMVVVAGAPRAARRMEPIGGGETVFV